MKYIILLLGLSACGATPCQKSEKIMALGQCSDNTYSQSGTTCTATTDTGRIVSRSLPYAMGEEACVDYGN